MPQAAGTQAHSDSATPPRRHSSRSATLQEQKLGSDTLARSRT